MAVKAIDETIALFVNQIRYAHLRDFGIPLEWPKEPVEEREE